MKSDSSIIELVRKLEGEANNLVEAKLWVAQNRIAIEGATSDLKDALDRYPSGAEQVDVAAEALRAAVRPLAEFLENIEETRRWARSKADIALQDANFYMFWNPNRALFENVARLFTTGAGVLGEISRDKATKASVGAAQELLFEVEAATIEGEVTRSAALLQLLPTQQKELEQANKELEFTLGLDSSLDEDLIQAKERFLSGMKQLETTLYQVASSAASLLGKSQSARGHGRVFNVVSRNRELLNRASKRAADLCPKLRQASETNSPASRALVKARQMTLNLEVVDVLHAFSNALEAADTLACLQIELLEKTDELRKRVDEGGLAGDVQSAIGMLGKCQDCLERLMSSKQAGQESLFECKAKIQRGERLLSEPLSRAVRKRLERMLESGRRSANVLTSSLEGETLTHAISSAKEQGVRAVKLFLSRFLATIKGKVNQVHDVLAELQQNMALLRSAVMEGTDLADTLELRQKDVPVVERILSVLAMKEQEVVQSIAKCQEIGIQLRDLIVQASNWDVEELGAAEEMSKTLKRAHSAIQAIQAGIGSPLLEDLLIETRTTAQTLDAKRQCAGR